MIRPRLIRALPMSLQAPACLLLIGHVYELRQRDEGPETRLLLGCEVCAHESVGVATGRTRTGRVLPGDPRRVEAYARRGIARPIRPVRSSRPEPLDDDWFAAEHFQGDHASAL